MGSAPDLSLVGDNFLWHEVDPGSGGAITAHHACASATPLGRHCMYNGIDVALNPNLQWYPEHREFSQETVSGDIKYINLW